MKYTPGPWKARKPMGMNGMYHVFIQDSKDHILGRIDGYVNGESCRETGYPDKQETIANAALMVAAPELVKALKEAIATVKAAAMLPIVYKEWEKISQKLT